MTLIDTSAWVHALRLEGDPDVTSRVRVLLESGEAAWCPLVQLELWNGARGNHEKRVLKQMSADLPSLDIDGAVWAIAFELAQMARQRGITAPATDILVAACARRHGAGIEHADKHMEALSELPT